jgi:hypothetical protein
MSVRIRDKQIGADPGLSAAPPKKKVSTVQRLYDSLQEQDKRQRKARASDAVAYTAQRSLSLHTPIRRLPCFTTYTEDHASLIQKYFNPLMHPPQSVAPLLTPLRSFAKQLPVTDPKFTLYISPKGEETRRGCCNHKKKRIHLFNDPSMTFSTTLLHELSHLAIDKLGWREKGQESFRKYVLQEALKDIQALSTKNWRSCDIAVKQRLFYTPLGCRQEGHWEEYLVRVPQIISEMARVCHIWSDVEIEARINRNIPHLFKIYKETFLPQLRAYVAKANSLCTSKKRADTDKVIKELQYVLKQRMQPSMSAEEEALKDSRVVGLSVEPPDPQPIVAVLKEEPSKPVAVQSTTLKKQSGKPWDFTYYRPSKITLFVLGLGAFIVAGRLRR